MATTILLFPISTTIVFEWWDTGALLPDKLRKKRIFRVISDAFNDAITTERQFILLISSSLFISILILLVLMKLYSNEGLLILILTLLLTSFAFMTYLIGKRIRGKRG